MDLQLIPIVRRAAQYIVYSKPGLFQGCHVGCDFVCGLPQFYPMVRFPDISSEVSRVDQFFHQEF